MSQQHSFWEDDEAPAVRKFRVWERSTHGASITLGNKPAPPIRRPYRADPLPPPPPLTTVPEMTPDNCQAIIAEVLAHHHLDAAKLDTHRSKGDALVSACVQELGYRLVHYGRLGGEPLSLLQIGKLMHRHHSSVWHGARRHQDRLRQFEGRDAVE